MHKHCRQQQQLSSQCNTAHHVPGSPCHQQSATISKHAYSIHTTAMQQQQSAAFSSHTAAARQQPDNNSNGI